MSRETAEDRALRAELSALASAEGNPLIGGIPERWMQHPRFRCTNFHVADRFGLTRRGQMICIFCELAVQQTFPEDRSGPLAREARGLPAQRTIAQVNNAERPAVQRRG